MFNPHAGAALLAALVLALPLAAFAHDRQAGHADDRLVDKYARFAGSESNAESLVNGLRNDGQVTLSSGGRSTTFTPATDKMGYGNVDIALGLAKATLAEQGIRRPTPEQIKAALNGGTVTSKSGERVALPGVLKLRASGMGWGKIAQQYDLKLGEVMRHKHNDWKRGEFHKTRFERIERPQRPERPERPERHHRR
jgi:hypothetical protein